MSYVKFEHRSMGAAHWIDATPEAFTVHVWALDYCNEQATNGTIPKKVAHRLVCPVEPAEIPAAFAVLVETGVWEDAGDAYHCPEFLAHGIDADEQSSTRDKWATDKRRRRLHNIGNHQLCTANSCVAARTGGTESTSPPVDKWTTRPDPTRLDSTPKGRVEEGLGGRADARSATATRASAPRVVKTIGEAIDPANHKPTDVWINLNDYDADDHIEIICKAAVAREQATDATELEAGHESFRDVSRRVFVAVRQVMNNLEANHGCLSASTDDVCDVDMNLDDPDDPGVTFTVPRHLGGEWLEMLGHEYGWRLAGEAAS